VRKNIGFWLSIALALPGVTGCNKDDPKAAECEAEVQKLRADVKKLRDQLADHEWEIAALKAKSGAPGAEAAKRRDLLLGKWAAPDKGSIKGAILEFTKDGRVAEETFHDGGGSGLRGAPGSSGIGSGPYLWWDDDHIVSALKIQDEKNNFFSGKHKVVVTKDELTLTNPNGDARKYKRLN
jgi:hypothetical protein